MRGADLSEAYYEQVVRAALERHWPGLPHAAGRLGAGSDVLGLDDDMSRDHDWGLRLTVLLDTSDAGSAASPTPERVSAALDESLPDEFDGHPTRFTTSWDARERHRVDVTTVEAFLGTRIGVGTPHDLDSLGWLALTGQAVLEVTAGRLFHDASGTVTRARTLMATYPRDVRLQVLAAGWWRISQELHLLGRAGQVHDDVGARALTGRLAGVILHLGCVVGDVWAPYPKWLGTAVSRLPFASRLVPPLRAALAADDWMERQDSLGLALTALYDAQRGAGLPVADGVPVRPFYDRPFLGVDDAVLEALRAEIHDPLLRALPPGIGAIEQWCDGPAVLMDAQRRRAVVCAAARG
ncbi:DUF4037 domain-containing protein [Cellulomonas shaoxiangyii]|uniref:DUF4037 domain-containing protein n=1 Tax=Cellulomonas shaoxiangyii TaxID=2566013 RepID=UPI001422C707|nr:DUF4037 domain-containing protein [Cellulomonas shaoxiangyii]